MLVFYQRLFPFRYLFEWLNYSSCPTKAFTNREFAFTLQKDIYLRYLSFATHSAFKAQVIAMNPKRFEIGPVYSANPRDRKSLQKKAFRPLEKELVFDIDLTDYDDIRTCCTEANICHKCWGFITIAILILDAALKEDFGFKHVLWVYSGRRGAHAWISDARARKYDDHIRKSLASYLEVVKGSSHSGKRVNVPRPLHPHLQRSLDICKGEFAKLILEYQDPWREQKGYERLLQLLPDKGLIAAYDSFNISDLNAALRKKWESHENRSSLEKWADIDAIAESGVSKATIPSHYVILTNSRWYQKSWLQPNKTLFSSTCTLVWILRSPSILTIYSSRPSVSIHEQVHLHSQYSKFLIHRENLCPHWFVRSCLIRSPHGPHRHCSPLWNWFLGENERVYSRSSGGLGKNKLKGLYSIL